ncbi:MAG: nitroreductase family protein [Firmicutes bacterium]|nr:nitroreductase family protein [Bacillota bacterium]
MESIKNILSRRSVRKYLNKPVSEEDLREILEAGAWAPSALNLQPWYFVAIRTEEQRMRMYEILHRVADRLEPSLRARFAKAPAVVDETMEFIRDLGGAPVYILAFWLKPDYENEADMINLSIAAAMQNILLAAHDKGLGSCWLTAPVETKAGDELRDMFAPGKGSMVAMIAMGYPAQEPKAPKRKDGRYIIV